MCCCPSAALEAARQAASPYTRPYSAVPTLEGTLGDGWHEAASSPSPTLKSSLPLACSPGSIKAARNPSLASLLTGCAPC